MSLAYNTEIVVQILPCLTSLSELPESLKHYEPQLRFTLEALKLDNRMVTGLAATLQDAYEFMLRHEKHVAERNARDQYLAVRGFTPKNYHTPDPLSSQASALTRRKRRLTRAVRTVWPEA